jgi:hypothetical protein
MTTNCVQTFHEPPSLRPHCSSRSAVGHPRAGTKLHPGKRNPRPRLRLRKTALCNWKDSLQGAYLRPTAHRLSFPTCLSHPGNMHLHCSTVHRLLHFPSRASTTGQIRNSQSSVAGTGLPPGEITSQQTLSPGESFSQA